jgi:hypothetical protein
MVGTRIRELRSIISHPQVSLLDIVVGLAQSHDPESYAGGSIAIGRVSCAR